MNVSLFSSLTLLSTHILLVLSQTKLTDCIISQEKKLIFYQGPWHQIISFHGFNTEEI